MLLLLNNKSTVRNLSRFFIAVSFPFPLFSLLLVEPQFRYSRAITMSLTSTPVRTLLTFDSLRFDNRNLRVLPVDKGPPLMSRQVPNAVFSQVAIQPVKNPIVICISPDALALLGLPQKYQHEYSDDEINKIATYFSGNEIIPGSIPAAHVYCGHQFGSFAGQLGDGAAMYLGEILGPDLSRWELQLKGAGRTPFSRTADGRKVLRSSIREFLCSEAMHYLNIPTTRAGTVVTSDSTVERDPYYDGNTVQERCTIVSRIATNFFRFGSFEIFKNLTGGEDRKGPSAGNEQLKRLLLDHVLSYYPDIPQPTHEVGEGLCSSGDSSNSYTLLLAEVVKRTATLVAKWQGVGFVHGVLNTDNLSIMGLTIDFGPFGFMEHFDPEYTPNGSDNSGRYTYESQPEICKWNLKKLAEMFVPYVRSDIGAAIIDTYDGIFESAYLEIMSSKLGFKIRAEATPSSAASNIKSIVEDLFSAMTQTYADFTDTFQALVYLAEDVDAANGDASAESMAIQAAINKLVSRCASPPEMVSLLKRKLRIHRVSMHPQQLITLLNMMENQPEELSDVFNGAPLEGIKQYLLEEKRKYDKLANTSQTLSQWKQKVETDLSGCTAEKKASDEIVWREWIEKYVVQLKTIRSESSGSLLQSINGMKANNPTFVLRNWIAQETISAADKNDFSKVHTVLHMLTEPFKESYGVFYKSSTCEVPHPTYFPSSEDRVSSKESEFIRQPPDWADGLLCTCSS